MLNYDQEPCDCYVQWGNEYDLVNISKASWTFHTVAFLCLCRRTLNTSHRIKYEPKWPEIVVSMPVDLRYIDQGVMVCCSLFFRRWQCMRRVVLIITCTVLQPLDGAFGLSVYFAIGQSIYYVKIFCRILVTLCIY